MKLTGISFIRKLRPTQSELGTYDNAASFKIRKMRTITSISLERIQELTSLEN